MPGGTLSSADLPPGAASVTKREDAIDPPTCVYLDESGAPSADELGGPPPSGSSTSSSTATGPANHLSPPAGAQAHAAIVKSHRAYLDTSWVDPFGITVNYVHLHEYWSDNGACVLTSSAEADYDWYSPTGWFNFGGFLNDSRSCYHGLATAYQAYGNHTFCLGQEVNSYYNENNLAGHYNGQWAANWNDYNTGAACRDLLHFDVTAGYF